MPGYAFGARRLLGPLLALVLAVAAPMPAAAQELAITTPYPSLTVQPGATASFPIAVHTDVERRVDLAVSEVPDGWTATLRGGGYEIGAVHAGPGEAPEVTLDVDVPDDAGAGPQTVTVTGTGDGEEASLSVVVDVASAASGSVQLSTDFPSARGFGDEEFEFSLELSNDTPQPLTFGLQATGPRGWEVTVQPSGQASAASVTVEARASQRLEVRAIPPPQVAAGSYPLLVEATAGEHSGAAELVVEITGRQAMSLTTEDQRLNTTVTAGSTQEVTVVVLNEGTAPLVEVSLSATPPREWEVTFEPATIEQVAPGQTATAVARIAPAAAAIAGDYEVTLSASAEGLDDSIQMRVTVETSLLWGAVGVLLIVGALGSLAWVFRRYGRR